MTCWRSAFQTGLRSLSFLFFCSSEKESGQRKRWPFSPFLGSPAAPANPSHGHQVRDLCYFLNACICYIDPSRQQKRKSFLCSFVSPFPRPQKRERERGKKKSPGLDVQPQSLGRILPIKQWFAWRREMLHFRLQAKTVVSQASAGKSTGTLRQEYNDAVKNTHFSGSISQQVRRWPPWEEASQVRHAGPRHLAFFPDFNHGAQKLS